MIKQEIRTAALVLAAGFGKRLREIGPKPLIIYHGKTFLETIFEKVEKINLNPIVIVTNRFFYSEIQKLNLPAKTVINKNPEMGMLSSILVGLEKIESKCDGFFLCPVDYPLVQLETYLSLLSNFCKNSTRIIKPQFNNQSGHPIVIPQNLFNELHSTPIDKGARYVTGRFSHKTIFVNISDPGILININTPKLYQQYCK